MELGVGCLNHKPKMRSMHSWRQGQSQASGWHGHAPVCGEVLACEQTMGVTKHAGCCTYNVELVHEGVTQHAINASDSRDTPAKVATAVGHHVCNNNNNDNDNNNTQHIVKQGAKKAVGNIGGCT